MGPIAVLEEVAEASGRELGRRELLLLGYMFGRAAADDHLLLRDDERLRLYLRDLLSRFPAQAA